MNFGDVEHSGDGQASDAEERVNKETIVIICNRCGSDSGIYSLLKLHANTQAYIWQNQNVSSWFAGRRTAVISELVRATLQCPRACWLGVEVHVYSKTYILWLRQKICTRNCLEFVACWPCKSIM